MKRDERIDSIFLALTITLITVGFFIFVSAALGVLARGEEKFVSVLRSQILFGLMAGGLCMYIASRIHYQFWRKHAFWIFVGSIAATLLVFVPGIGFEHGGAHRWIHLGVTTFQPSELLKFGLVVYLAAWFAAFHKRIQSPLFGFYPLLAMVGITGAVLLAQPDTGTFLIAAAAGVAMRIVSAGKWHELLIMLLLGVLLIGVLAYARPYVRDRIETMLQPSDFQGSGYQIKQAWIAIGNGGYFGAGYGQSTQKFTYLPEPIGDSVFAVAAEELGFVGASGLIVLFLLFALRGLYIAARAPDKFSGLLVIGLVILIISQSFTNIGSMLGLGPLTGVPLVFVSHGGSAMLLAMIEVGIILNISRYRMRIPS